MLSRLLARAREKLGPDAFPFHDHRRAAKRKKWFNIITQKAIRRGSFSSVTQLKEKILRFTEHYNNSGTQPFARRKLWTATADSILQKIQRLCTAISGTQH